MRRTLQQAAKQNSMAYLQLVSHTDKMYYDPTNQSKVKYVYDTYKLIVPTEQHHGVQYYTGMEFHYRPDTNTFFTGRPMPQFGNWNCVMTYETLEHMLTIQAKIDTMTESLYGTAPHRTPFHPDIISKVVALWDNKQVA